MERESMSAVFPYVAGDVLESIGVVTSGIVCVCVRARACAARYFGLSWVSPLLPSLSRFESFFRVIFRVCDSPDRSSWGCLSVAGGTCSAPRTLLFLFISRPLHACSYLHFSHSSLFLSHAPILSAGTLNLVLNESVRYLVDPLVTYVFPHPHPTPTRAGCLAFSAL